MNELEQKQARLVELQNQLDAEYQKESIDEPAVNKIIHEMNTINQQIADLQAGQQAQEVAEQAHQERVEQATDELSDLIDNLDVGDGLTLRNYLNSESDYQLVSIAIKQGVTAKMAAMSELIKGYDERELQMQRQNSLLQQQITTQQQQIGSLQNEKADLETKLANAANELDKANTEADSLRAQLAAKTKPAEATPEMTEDERNRRILEKKAEITVYNVVGDSELNPKNYTATIAATGESITYNWTQKNRFIIVSEDEAARFRQAYEAAQPQPEAAEPTAPVDTVPAPVPPAIDVAFRTEDAQDEVSREAIPAPAVVDTSAAEDAQGAVTREEFEAVKARLDRLEQQLPMGAVA